MESIPLSTLKSHFQNPFPKHIFQIVGGGLEGGGCGGERLI